MQNQAIVEIMTQGTAVEARHVVQDTHSRAHGEMADVGFLADVAKKKI
jgi:hypothetical protein